MSGPHSLCQFTRATITKDWGLGDINSRSVFSHSSGVRKSEVKVSAGLVASEASLHGVYVASISLCPQVVALSLCVICVLISFCKDASAMG